MPNVTVDKVLDKDIYAKGNVNGYDYTLKTVKHVYANGERIGTIYSWITGADGNIYYLIYPTASDYNNFNATYVKHDASQISLPALPDILAQIQAEKEAKEKQDKGIVQYYIEKYAPWIVGGIVVAVALPSITNSLTQKKVGAMTEENKNIMGVLAAGAVVFLLTKKKRKGSVIVDPLDKGDFGPAPLDPMQDSIYSQPGAHSVNAGGNTVSAQQSGGNRLMYIGPFEAAYADENSNKIIAGKKGFGNKKTC